MQTTTRTAAAPRAAAGPRGQDGCQPGAALTGTGWPGPAPPAPPGGSRAAPPGPAAGPAAAGRDHVTPPGAAPAPARPGREPAASRDRSGAWLAAAAAGLGVLAGAAAAVSFAAQYQMVDTARRTPVIAGLEAAIPDAAALVFACLGVALALHGRRAVRARFLNVAAVGTSVFMNALAAAPGWQGLAIWVMPPVAYALASDTLIGVVRAWVIAGHRAARPALADEDATPLAVLGGLILWLLRLALAPASTLSGFRAWVIAECPVAPGRTAGTAIRPAPAVTPPRTPARRPGKPGGGRRGTKTARFLALAERRHGPLAGIPLAAVARICADLAPRADLHPGAARTALRSAVLAARKENTP